jgi:arsenate reductase
MSTARPYNVLFLCTGNSARSILAEATLNSLGGERFRAWSAGSFPVGSVNPVALDLLRLNRIPTDDLRSKSWDEFARPGAPEMDFVFTVCDDAAGEVCPVWPGQPVSAHWGVEDPARASGDGEDQRRAMFKAFNTLKTRIQLLVDLPLDKLDHAALRHRLDHIGEQA